MGPLTVINWVMAVLLGHPETEFHCLETVYLLGAIIGIKGPKWFPPVSVYKQPNTPFENSRRNTII